MKSYEDMDLNSIVGYINSELLKGRSMRDIEENDFGVNDRVITKRLARKNIKRVDGQFVLQSGSKMLEKSISKNIPKVHKNSDTDIIVKLSDNIEFVELKNKVDFLEEALKEVICIQSGSKVVANDLGLRIYSSDEKPVAKTIRLHQDIWNKIDRVKAIFPHINYQTLLNSLIDEITDKYLKDEQI